MTYNYVTYEQAGEKHDEVIGKSGGKLGVRNADDIKGVLAFVQDDGFYPDLVEIFFAHFSGEMVLAKKGKGEQ